MPATFDDAEQRDRKCELVVQASEIEADDSGFPVLLTEVNFPAEIFTLAQNGGGDLRFATEDADPDSNQIPCDVVTFDTVSSKAEVYVKRSISALADRSIWVYYDTSSTSSQPAASHAYGADNAYPSTYDLFLPMAEDPSGSAPQMLDRTSNNNDGTTAGTMTSSDSITGQIGNGLALDGSDDAITIPDSDSLDFAGDEAFTIIFWMKHGGGSGSILNKRTGGVGYKIDNSAYGLNIALHADYYDVLEVYTDYDWLGSIEDAWHQIAITYDGSEDNSGITLYTDGESYELILYTNTLTGDFHTSADLKIFHTGHNADIDSLHIIRRELSNDELMTRYNNESSPATFTVEGTPADVAAADVTSPWYYTLQQEVAL